MSNNEGNNQNPQNNNTEDSNVENVTTTVDTTAEEVVVEQEALAAKVAPVKIVEQLKTCFINYAMSVIVDRALPDVKDGLKPVQRRCLYATTRLKYFYGTKTQKSAKVVGEVMGKYHPHGDSSIYETLVRMAQSFSLRYPLIHGQGNFGSIDGDGAAAMRYTELTMSKIAGEMVADLDKETVDVVPNYDNSETIPTQLPAKFPNLLVNGATGIAVGMATNIPPHNLVESIDASIALIKNPQIGLDELMRIIPGPDFPTGGIIVGTSGIKEAYETGRGRVIMRGRTHVEGNPGSKQLLVIDEIPYALKKKDLVDQIYKCCISKEKTIDGVTDVIDASGKDYEVRIEIELKKDEYPDIVLNKLYKQTDLQTSFPINMTALVDNHPDVLSLKQILDYFIKHRYEVVTRRTVFDLAEARKVAHRQEAYLVALNNIDEMITIIKTSKNKQDAAERLLAHGWQFGELDKLIERLEDGTELCKPSDIPAQFGIHNNLYYLSEPQVNAILEMQLHRLTNLENDKIVALYNEKVADIKEYLHILNSEERLKEVVIEELIEIRDKYGDKRRSEIIIAEGEISKKDLIASESAVVTLSRAGYIKYQPITEYDTQRRGGVGKRAAKMKDEDVVDSMYVVNTHDTVLCFTNLGRVYALNVFDLPLASSTAKGLPIQNLLNLNQEAGERVQVILPVDNFEGERYLFFATANGMVKKTKLSAYKNLRRVGLIAIKLREGDELVNVAITSGEDNIALFSSAGFACIFNEYYNRTSDAESEDESEEDGLNAELTEDTEAQDSEDENGEENQESIAKGKGLGLRPQGRNGSGCRGIRLTPGAKLVSMIVIDKDIDNFILVCENGFGKRTRVSDFPIRNRNCKGVIAIKTTERNGKLVDVLQIKENDQLMIINSLGILIRTKVDAINVIGRAGQGVKLIRLLNDAKVVSIQRIKEEDIVEDADVVDVIGTDDENAVVDVPVIEEQESTETNVEETSTEE